MQNANNFKPNKKLSQNTDENKRIKKIKNNKKDLVNGESFSFQRARDGQRELAKRHGRPPLLSDPSFPMLQKAPKMSSAPQNTMPLTFIITFSSSKFMPTATHLTATLCPFSNLLLLLVLVSLYSLFYFEFTTDPFEHFCVFLFFVVHETQLRDETGEGDRKQNLL